MYIVLKLLYVDLSMFLKLNYFEFGVLYVYDTKCKDTDISILALIQPVSFLESKPCFHFMLIIFKSVHIGVVVWHLTLWAYHNLLTSSPLQN